MADLFASGRLIDLILALVVIEAIALTLVHRLTGTGVAPHDLIGLLLAGAFLLVAVRLALTDADWVWIGFWLGLALCAHLVDLAMRWRS